MKSLKQKWTEASPVLVGILCALGIVWLFGFGIYKLATMEDKSDTMTVQQVIEKRYKSCVAYSSYPGECNTIINLPNLNN